MVLVHQHAIKAIQYKNIGLQGEIRAKDQERTHLQERYMDYFANEDKTMALTPLRETMKQQGIPMYLQAGSISTEDTTQSLVDP